MSSLIRYGKLDAIEIKGRPGAPTVVFFHGYGADCHDLAPLARALGVSRDVNWLFPNAPLGVALGGHREGRAWFPISIQGLEQAPAGIKKARELALECLQAAGIQLPNAVLGGFSQGAMVAADLALRAPDAPRGLTVLSGTLLDEVNWQRLADARRGSSFFQSHGTRDPVLPFSGAKKLEAVLLKAGWVGSLLDFDGGHEIPLQVQSALSIYLRKALA